MGNRSSRYRPRLGRENTEATRDTCVLSVMRNSGELETVVAGTPVTAFQGGLVEELEELGRGQARLPQDRGQVLRLIVPCSGTTATLPPASR